VCVKMEQASKTRTHVSHQMAHLAVRELQSTVANAGCGLPELDGVVIARCCQDHAAHGKFSAGPTAGPPPLS